MPAQGHQVHVMVTGSLRFQINKSHRSSAGTEVFATPVHVIAEHIYGRIGYTLKDIFERTPVIIDINDYKSYSSGTRVFFKIIAVPDME
jgi:hypothetical protein